MRAFENAWILFKYLTFLLELFLDSSKLPFAQDSLGHILELIAEFHWLRSVEMINNSIKFKSEVSSESFQSV